MNILMTKHGRWSNHLSRVSPFIMLALFLAVSSSAHAVAGVQPRQERSAVSATTGTVQVYLPLVVKARETPPPPPPPPHRR